MVDFLLLSWCSVLASPSFAEESDASRVEYEVKAAFVHNFINYIEWPSDSFESEDSPIQMGILGQGPITESLVNLNGKEVKNRSLLVSAINSLENLKEYHIIFLNPSEKETIASILSSLNNSSVLTIGDIPGFAEECGIINFYLKGGKVRFEVNVAAFRRERLKISSKLLRLARIVNSECD